ncbi:membrane protein SB87 [Capsaspora owczarzaki ATCC 30864]|uniref:Mannosyltransferase n=1 Tax=Capsaspora owczarzaki (strain ATCC 30864) TaxID=595528 RepID=A0A0D2VFE7_CAPO3|nr:membrane protein SB87 [Capsaspora owczarzaki ATCC 30864]KJE88452.1 membrane protein SB87 [Capsaspora owczarzaki ATCC 30864]|eukprot:XP_004364979.1 membrane protein SB87 [Capsaspora owczarzaki ATCC 30864]
MNATQLQHVLLDLLVVLAVVLYVVVCPFTKVEESFNIQAIHDLLFALPQIQPVNNIEGLLARSSDAASQLASCAIPVIPSSVAEVHPSDWLKYVDCVVEHQFDHSRFTGPVPRTFIGAILVAAMSAPFAIPAFYAFHSKLAAQLIVRIVLGLFVAWTFGRFLRAITRRYSLRTAVYVAILSICQFHFLFYASRTLPNTMALPFVLLALAAWLDGRRQAMVAWFAFAGIIFRAELVVLFAPLLLSELVVMLLASRAQPHTAAQPSSFGSQFAKLVGTGIVAGIASLALTILVDSVFWRRWLWPEGEVLYFNTVLNQSVNWGTMPFHWYFTSALPRALLVAYPLSVVGAFKHSQPFVVAACFVLGYSFLPHKELRFIFYSVPLFNLSAALGLQTIYNAFDRPATAAAPALLGGHVRSLVRLVLKWLANLGLLLSVVATLFFLFGTTYNYPGGEAILYAETSPQVARMAARSQGEARPVLHVTNLAAQTGVTRFLQMSQYWEIDKTEGMRHATNYTSFDIVIGEPQHRNLLVDSYSSLATIPIFDGTSTPDFAGIWANVTSAFVPPERSPLVRLSFRERWHLVWKHLKINPIQTRTGLHVLVSKDLTDRVFGAAPSNPQQERARKEVEARRQLPKD